MADTTQEARTPTEAALREKGILLCYNQFAPHYPNFQAMITELPEIAAMGYNAVMSPPLHPTSQFPKFNGKKGSLYAPVDYTCWRADFFGTGDVKQQVALLRQYTSRAKELGLVPMFDLVLAHMGRTSEAVPNLLECGDDWEKNRAINDDTRYWFKRDADHNLVIDGVQTDKPDGIWRNGEWVDLWDDIAQFNYENPQKRRQIIDHLWKPLVEKYMGNNPELGQLGFMGCRVDAAHKIHPEVLKEVLGHAAAVCQQHHGRAPVIMAETVGIVSDDQRRGMEGCHITHVTNNSFWMPSKHEPDHWHQGTEEVKKKWNEASTYLDCHRYGMRWVVRYDPEGGEPHMYPKSRGGTIGIYDSHDHEPRAHAWKEELTSAEDKEQALREVMAVAAFYADAGSVGCTGVHLGDDRHRSVFISENDPNKPQPPRMDMSAFVRELNLIQAAQPAQDVEAVTNRFFLPEKPELVVMVTHDFEQESAGGPRLEKTYLKLANTRPGHRVQLTSDDVNTLAFLGGKPPEDFAAANPAEKGIFTCGGINLQLPAAVLDPNTVTHGNGALVIAA